MSGLMGDWSCRPVVERGIYAVYLKGDVDALKERCRRLEEGRRELVAENVELARELDRERFGPYEERDFTWMTD